MYTKRFENYSKLLRKAIKFHFSSPLFTSICLNERMKNNPIKLNKI